MNDPSSHNDESETNKSSESLKFSLEEKRASCIFHVLSENKACENDMLKYQKWKVGKF